MQINSKQKIVKKRAGRVSALRFTVKMPFMGGEWLEYLDARRIAELLGVSRQTAYKWMNATHTIEPHRLQLLQILATGILPFKGWENWRIDGGKLFAPNRFSFTPEELSGFSYIKELNAEYKHLLAERDTEIATLKAQLQQLRENRPVTAQIISLKDYHQKPRLKKPG